MVVKNPKNIPFSSTYTLQKCDDCGFQGYAEKFKPPLWSKCPVCNSQNITVL